MSEQMINHVNNWEKANQERNNESLTAELERYKERVKIFEQHLNINLSTRKKMIDSQMDDMIKEKLALKQQIDSLEKNLPNQIKEKESLLQTFTVFKNESKEKESKYLDNKIDLEKNIKELDNIVYKVDFRKRFVPQQELYDEQAFWLQTSHPNTDQSASSPVKIEDPQEIPKEQAGILQGIVEQAKAKQPLDNALDFSYKHAKQIQELLVYVRDASPNAYKPSEKMIAVTPMNKVKKVRFSKPLTSSSNIKQVVQIVRLYRDLICSKHMTGNRSQLMNFISKFLGTVRFRNDQIAKIMGYGDYQLGNVIISRVYYVEGLGHNLFSVGQFCDADLEVVFRKNTCFIRNLEGVDLLSRSRDTNLYTISLDDMLKTSPIYLLSKASKTKSWLWHRQLSHLNFGTPNKLAKDGLARGISKLKFQKDHLCLTCALGKSKKSSHQPNAEETNQEKLYLLHMDLCGLMRVIFVRSKVEAPPTAAIIKCSGPGLQLMTPATYSSGLVPNTIPQQPSVSPVSTSIDQDAPSTQEQEHSLIISQGFEESPKTPHFHDDPLHESLHEDSTSHGSSSNVRPSHTPFEHLGRWTKDHPIANVIGDPSRSVSTRKQLETDAMWCYFDAFLTSVEPKNFKQAMTEPSWIDAMQKEIHEL
ncbi:integrase, catalytic region, zinc finger, CCHC-type containing protein [Tanacetum coccineum]